MINEIKATKKILRFLRKPVTVPFQSVTEKAFRLVDCIGGVKSGSGRPLLLHYPTAVSPDQIVLFNAAKKLEAKGLLKVVFRTGRNWVVGNLEDETPSIAPLFDNSLVKLSNVNIPYRWD